MTKNKSHNFLYFFLFVAASLGFGWPSLGADAELEGSKEPSALQSELSLECISMKEPRDFSYFCAMAADTKRLYVADSQNIYIYDIEDTLSVKESFFVNYKGVNGLVAVSGKLCVIDCDRNINIFDIGYKILQPNKVIKNSFLSSAPAKYVVNNEVIHRVEKHLGSNVDVINIVSGKKEETSIDYQDLAMVGDKIYVLNRFSLAVSVIDASSKKVVSKIALSAEQPKYLAVIGDKLYVGYSSAQISIIDTKKDQEIALVNLPITLAKYDEIGDLVVIGDKLLLISQEDWKKKLLVFDPKSCRLIVNTEIAVGRNKLDTGNSERRDYLHSLSLPDFGRAWDPNTDYQRSNRQCEQSRESRILSMIFVGGRIYLLTPRGLFSLLLPQHLFESYGEACSSQAPFPFKATLEEKTQEIIEMGPPSQNQLEEAMQVEQPNPSHLEEAMQMDQLNQSGLECIFQ